MRDTILELDPRPADLDIPRLEGTLKKIDGVSAASVTPEGRIVVSHDDAVLPPPRLVAALAKAGYVARFADGAPPFSPEERRTRRIPFGTKRLDFRIRGMHCATCAATIEEALRKVPGVQSVAVNLAAETGQVAIDPGKVDKEEVYRRVRLAGYEPRDPEPPAVEAAGEALEARRALIGFLLAAFPAAVLMALMLAGAHGPVATGLAFGLATIVQFGPGLAFYEGAARALCAGRPNMDVLVALGITAAYGMSVATVAGAVEEGGHVYFETAAALVAFIRLGKLLEARARGRAGRALRELLALEPAYARRLGAKGAFERVAIRDVRPGDILEVLAGEKVPVDGEVIEGRSAVDESAVTGESAPVEKEPGSPVIGATVNRSATFRMRALRVGEETLLARIVRMVREAQAEKAPIERLADAVSAVFVPVVLLLAAATFAAWTLAGEKGPRFALEAAIAVVVIACPCALGLATPTAILVGSAIGLRRGILVKKASALEEIARIDLLFLDKTGTLTRGVFEATDVAAAPGANERQVLAIAAALERHSTHPLARGIVARAERDAVEPLAPIEDIEEQGGRGIAALAEGERARAGSQKFMEESFVEIPRALVERAGALAAEGKSLVFVARGGEAIGALALADAVRPEAPEVVRELRGLGIEVAMVTGDNAVAARAVARAVGIARVEAEVAPDKKGRIVAQAAEGGRRVGFAGDGINDAPALAAASVGIAIGSGTDVAKETGDIVLVRDDLRDIVRAVRLGRATLRKVRQNLFLAFVYNVLAIPLAAGALYPGFGILLRPEFAGLAMALSSVSVVTNALLLRRVERRL